MKALQSSLFYSKYAFPLLLLLGFGPSILQAQISTGPFVLRVPSDLSFRAIRDESTGTSVSSSTPDIDSPDNAATPAGLVSPSESSAIVRTLPAPVVPAPQRYGGTHEFAVTVGIARMSGHWLGYRKDVDTEVINLRYSRVMKNGRHVTYSYSTEVTPYINLEEPIYNNNDTGNVEISRKQTVGGGVTPIGFSFDFFPGHRIQPFWRCNYGVLYFHDRVLSPEGSQFMHTVDFGLGFHIYQTHNISTTLGFRYIHMSNANIADHNPGTDAETFYIGFSRFHSPKSRRVE
jgi:hypothetical protein